MAALRAATMATTIQKTWPPVMPDCRAASTAAVAPPPAEAGTGRVRVIVTGTIALE